jgi:DNA helicase-2/ATP-dependent DNA helicase PcrA
VDNVKTGSPLFPPENPRGTILLMAPQLNPAQRKAVETLSGPLLVLAGAGTGKTRVVTYRIANLIRHGTQPSRILAVTFTNKAAKEMQERVSEQLGPKIKDGPVVSTFHSHCVKVLRRHIKQLGYPEKFAIYDRSDQEGVARAVLREIKVPGSLMRPGDLLNIIGGWKTHCVRPADASSLAQTDKEHLAAMAYGRYQKALKQAGAVDFDDLLLCTEQLFHEFPEIRAEEAGLFDHLLIDEYQDTNGSQYRIVKALAGEHRNLCVVGDDDQSIYGWRGAEVQHILSFSKDWPDAVEVRLEHNYRSTAAIIELANRIIEFNGKRHDKILIPARQGGEKPKINQHQDPTIEATAVVTDIQRRLTLPELDPGDFAILFRTNEQPRVFEQELRKAKLPYVLIGGMSFFDRREVRDIICYLRILESPHDEVSLRRIINRPARGITTNAIDKLLEQAVQKSCSLWDIMAGGNVGKLSAKAGASVKRFVQQIRSYQGQLQEGKRSLVDIVNSFIQEIRYEDEIKRSFPEPSDQESRMAAIEEVVNALGDYEQKEKRKDKTPDLNGFLHEIALTESSFGDDKDKQLKRRSIVLMTMHSAKGLEFPEVYLVGLEEGILPHHRSIAADGAAIDEERRLCYVGITRAQERLTMSMALTRMKWGKPRETIASRFLFEIIGKAENPNKIRTDKAHTDKAQASQPAAKKLATAKGATTASPTKKQSPKKKSSTVKKKKLVKKQPVKKRPTKKRPVKKRPVKKRPVKKRPTKKPGTRSKKTTKRPPPEG